MPEDGIILRAFSIIGWKGEAEGAGAGHFILSVSICLSFYLSISLSLSSVSWRRLAMAPGVLPKCFLKAEIKAETEL